MQVEDNGNEVCLVFQGMKLRKDGMEQVRLKVWCLFNAM